MKKNVALFRRQHSIKLREEHGFNFAQLDHHHHPDLDHSAPHFCPHPDELVTFIGATHRITETHAEMRLTG